ncbi:MAG: hypothetical protein ACREO1_03555 [Arenimonas sp.]
MFVDELFIVTAREQTNFSFEPFHVWSDANSNAWCCFYRVENDYLLRFPDLADFKIDAESSQVCCWPAPNTAMATINQLYLNQVVPLVQSRKAKLVFHGGAIVADNKALAFVGVSGRGKSTLTASFSITNFPFLTDDGLLVKLICDDYFVTPSHPSIRLWDDSQLAVLDPHAKSEVPLDYTTKLRFPANKTMSHHQDLCKLHRIYFLGDPDAGCTEIKITKLSAQRALVELIKNSFLLDIEDKKMLTEHFDELSKLSLRGLFFELNYPRDYAELANVRAAILQHAGISGKIAASK